MAPAWTPFDAAICAAVFPLPYCFDESAFAEACTDAAASALLLPEAVQVVELSYVHQVPLFVLFAGFMPGVVADAFVPAPAEPETCVWPCVCADVLAACFSWPRLVADGFAPTVAVAVPETCTDADADTACFSCPGAVAELP